MDRFNLSISFLDKPIEINHLLYLIPLLSLSDNWIVMSIYFLFILLLILLKPIYDRNFTLNIPYFFTWCFLILWGVFITMKSPVIFGGVMHFIGIILIPFIIFIIFNQVRIDRNFLHKFFNLFILCGVILGLVSIFIFYESGFDLKMRISPLGQHINIVAISLLFFFLFNFSFLINRKKGEKLIIYILSALIILMGIFLSQTRGVWLSLIFTLLVYILSRPKIIIPMIVFSGLFLLLFYNTIESRFLTVKYFGNDISSLGRLQAWISSWLLIKDNLLFGYGFDSYIHLRDQVFSFYFVEVVHSHNTYLTILLEMGLIGFILYFTFFFISIKYVFSKKSKLVKEYKKYFDGIKLSLISCVPAFMFEPYFSLYGVSTITIWILISIVIRIKLLQKNNELEESSIKS